MLRTRRTQLLLIGLAVILPASWAWCPPQAAQPQPKVISLRSQGEGYLRLLGGPPETSTMRSGLVTLAPGKSVGRHNTEKYEEVLIILEGSAAVSVSAGGSIQVPEGYGFYCPPHTEHDVKNIGGGLLRYVYIVAEAKTR